MGKLDPPTDASLPGPRHPASMFIRSASPRRAAGLCCRASRPATSMLRLLARPQSTSASPTDEAAPPAAPPPPPPDSAAAAPATKAPTPSPASSPKWTAKNPPPTVHIRGQTVETDRDFFNVPRNVIDATAQQLHLKRDHPIAVTRQLIESYFAPPTYKHYNQFPPIVTARQNFDSLGFPPDHVSRSRSDTYYINRTRLLRTHTSAHQADAFRSNSSDGYLISADVYRRDEIDRSHYPVFHQLEGARSWDRNKVPGADIVAAVQRDLELIPKNNLDVQEPNPPFDPVKNPLQDGHSPEEVEAISQHLKRSLENMVADIFSRAEGREPKPDDDQPDKGLPMRWVEAYFPFTSPSWELEIFYMGEWLEVLGCGIVKQDLFNNADVPSRMGWAFGLGLERIAMLLFNIPDIRLFWSTDERFLSQFAGMSSNPKRLKQFAAFSKYPVSNRDISFWLPADKSGKITDKTYENDFMEVVRAVGGANIESVKLIDQFAHPKTGRRSKTYRIVYHSFEHTLSGLELQALHTDVRKAVQSRLAVDLR